MLTISNVWTTFSHRYASLKMTQFFQLNMGIKITALWKILFTSYIYFWRKFLINSYRNCFWASNVLHLSETLKNFGSVQNPANLIFRFNLHVLDLCFQLQNKRANRFFRRNAVKKKKNVLATNEDISIYEFLLSAICGDFISFFLSLHLSLNVFLMSKHPYTFTFHTIIKQISKKSPKSPTTNAYKSTNKRMYTKDDVDCVYRLIHVNRSLEYLSYFKNTDFNNKDI